MYPNFQFDLGLFCLFMALTAIDHRFSRWMMALLVFFSSGVILVANPDYSYFGLGTIVLGTLLFKQLGMLEHLFKTKLIAITLWTFAAIYISDQLSFHVSFGTSLSRFAFVFANILTIYILFEEEIRDLVAANRAKDAELAEKDAEIDRLAPLSELGERVAHVAHSFKNNLSLLGTAQILLEQGGDMAKASARMGEFTRSMNERIENILMVSQAGAERTPTVYDAARILEGLNQVFFSEPAFVHRAKVELDADQPTPILGVRWDFILLVENIMKNALDAISSREIYGTIRVTLKDRVLTLANNGGAMETCETCGESCLECPRYGKPGRTNKKGGSGHGLAQVFSTCRKYGWTLRIRAEGEWTKLEIGLTAPARIAHDQDDLDAKKKVT